MKYLLIILSIFLYSFSTETNEKKHKEFNLSYSYAGLGSQIGSIQPFFTIQGNSFHYINQQNSSFEELTVKPDTILSGKILDQKIDSILSISNSINDTLIYKTNPNITSGGIVYLSINNLQFKLHNTWDSRAQKIIDIINSQLPQNVKKLFIPKIEN